MCSNGGHNTSGNAVKPLLFFVGGGRYLLSGVAWGQQPIYLQGLWFCSTAYPLLIICAVSPSPGVWTQSLMPSQMWFNIDSKLPSRMRYLGPWRMFGHFCNFPCEKTIHKLIFGDFYGTFVRLDDSTEPVVMFFHCPRLHCPVSLYEKQLKLGYFKRADPVIPSIGKGWEVSLGKLQRVLLQIIAILPNSMVNLHEKDQIDLIVMTWNLFTAIVCLKRVQAGVF